MVNLKCTWCGKSFARNAYAVARAKQSFCSRTCKSKGDWQTQPVQRRMMKRPEHPIAPPGGIVSETRLILYDKIGPGPHQCHWCNRKIDWKPGEGPIHGALVADHLDSDGHNNDPENIVASCQPCNGIREIRVGDEELFIVRPNGTRLRAVERICQTCKKPFLVSPAQIQNKKNGGSYCSRQCLYDRGHQPFSSPM